jgi:hypothetical protein
MDIKNNNKCCIGKIPLFKNTGCKEVIQTKREYSFFEDEVYRDGKFYGYIIYKGVSLLLVMVNNGNKYMKGNVQFIYIKQRTNSEQTA